jgi:membrane-associated protein
VRTFAPILAGIIHMDWRRFMVYNVGGSALWSLTVVNLGYFAGKYIPHARDYLSYVIVLMVVVTAIPIVQAYRRRKKTA